MYRIVLCPTKLNLPYAYVYIYVRTTLKLSLFGKIRAKLGVLANAVFYYTCLTNARYMLRIISFIYIGRTGGCFEIRHRERLMYIKTNDPIRHMHYVF
jgi:hypothetical protein